MSRYFIELAYKGTAYSGFQSQKNANTIQAEVEKAFKILQKTGIEMIGSSRTDAGVHAQQNFFHFDFEEKIHPQFVYKINAILPPDIVIKKLIPVSSNAHCRFDAVSREYNYYIYQKKDPFLEGRAYYFPYKLDMSKLTDAAELIRQFNDFTSFSKRKTQVKTFTCEIYQSKWSSENDCLLYQVVANRFLRGMVKALVATMLLVGRNKISLDDFLGIIESRNCETANFSAPSHGLFLKSVNYPDDYFGSSGLSAVKM
jgi:tRNA pseudouridine38-40 synthase